MYNSIMKTVAMEAIDFQRDNFGKQLEDVLSELQKEKVTNKTNGSDYKAGKKIEQLIYQRFGLKINCRFETNSGPAILPPHVDKNHIFFSGFDREIISNYDMSKAIKELEGSDKITNINIAKAKVSGAYSTLENIIFLPLWFINTDKFSLSERAAIILHELGHAFTFLEYMGKFSKMNEMLQIVTSDAFKTATIKEKEIVVIKANSEDILDKDILDKLSNTNNKTQRTVVLLKYLLDPEHSAIGNLNYSATMCESLADNFAARFGYGKDLVIALDKLTNSYPDKSSFIRAMAIFNEILLYVATVLLFFSPSGVLVIADFLSICNLLNSGEANEDYSYDRLRVRYLRVREQIVQSMKSEDIPKEIIDRNVEDLKIIDQAISKVKDFNNLTSIVFNYVFAKHRNALEDVKRQRLLEEIASNDLFIKAAQLRTSV